MSLASGGAFPDESPVQEQVTTSCDQARITVILGPAPAMGPTYREPGGEIALHVPRHNKLTNKLRVTP